MEYTEDLYHGYKRIQFTFEGRDAILVFPKEADPQGRWLLKTEYFDAFPEFELEMVKRGFHLAFVKNITRWHKSESDDDDLALDVGDDEEPSDEELYPEDDF